MDITTSLAWRSDAVIDCILERADMSNQYRLRISVEAEEGCKLAWWNKVDPRGVGGMMTPGQGWVRKLSKETGESCHLFVSKSERLTRTENITFSFFVPTKKHH